MIPLNHLSRPCFFLLCFALSSVLLCRAQEQQSASVGVTVAADRAEFALRGDAREVRVEVYSPSGQKVFDSRAIPAGQTVAWDMRDKAGRRVADGIYLATVSTTDSEGKVSKRVEQIVVSADGTRQEAAAVVSGSPEATAAVSTTGTGTPGKLAKFTGADTIGNSIVTEANGKIGVNTNPVATLHLSGLQPGSHSTMNGASPVPLLQTSGGKGGNTTAAGKIAGQGANIILLAGNGGNAAPGALNGNGGTISLQPGSPGTGGASGIAGKVLIATSVGNVGIGTDKPAAKLDVVGKSKFFSMDLSGGPALEVFSRYLGGINVHSQNGLGLSTYGAIGGVSALSEEGTGVAGASTNGIGVRGDSINNIGVFGRGGIAEGVVGQSGLAAGVVGRSTQSMGVAGFSENNDSGVYGHSVGGPGVFGDSAGGDGVKGQSGTGYAGNFTGKAKVTSNFELGGNQFFGNTPRQMLNLYNTNYGIGVQNSTLYFRVDNTAGYNWYMGGVHNNTQNSPGTGGVSLMRLDSNGNLFTKGAVNPVSDRNAKSNFSSVNPRFILDKLAAIPIQTWSYKADSDAVRHLGPVAQDFRAAFNLGADDKHISTVDADGVALAAIQGLYQLTVEQNLALTRQNQELARKLELLQEQVAQLQRAVKPRAARKRNRR